MLTPPVFRGHSFVPKRSKRVGNQYWPSLERAKAVRKCYWCSRGPICKFVLMLCCLEVKSTVGIGLHAVSGAVIAVNSRV